VRSLAEADADPVLWISACAEDAVLLQTPVSGTPEDYSRHSQWLGRPGNRATPHTLGLLAILCAFQGVFVANAISTEEIGETVEWTAIEVEDGTEITPAI
jgi:hypothetical protein